MQVAWKSEPIIQVHGQEDLGWRTKGPEYQEADARVTQAVLRSLTASVLEYVAISTVAPSARVLVATAS